MLGSDLPEVSWFSPNQLLRKEGKDFSGVTVAKDGVARNHYETLSDYRETFVRQQFPDLDARLEEADLDLDEDLGHFFWGNCDLSEFSISFVLLRSLLLRR